MWIVDPLSTLLRCYPFQDVTASDLEPLLSSFVRREYRRGETIWSEGDPAEELWFILKGAVHGLHSTPDGEEIVTMLYGPGESFGEIGLFLPDQTRRVRCIATDDTTLMGLPRDRLLAFICDHPAALKRMLEMTSVMAFRQGVSFREHALRDVRRRVAWRLLDMVERHAEPVAGGTRINLRLTQTILAGIVGASRPNVSRALSSFSAAGAIRLEGGYIIVRNADQLRAALGSDEGMLLDADHRS
jgi:CRP/FNR family transcriptional regulator, cyclic AMP receptor protein